MSQIEFICKEDLATESVTESVTVGSSSSKEKITDSPSVLNSFLSQSSHNPGEEPIAGISGSQENSTLTAKPHIV